MHLVRILAGDESEESVYFGGGARNGNDQSVNAVRHIRDLEAMFVKPDDRGQTVNRSRRSFVVWTEIVRWNPKGRIRHQDFTETFRPFPPRGIDRNPPAGLPGPPEGQQSFLFLSPFFIGESSPQDPLLGNEFHVLFEGPWELM